jgi:leucyl-tRNA synthetase
LPIREVIAGGDVQKEAFVETDKGVVVNSTSPDGRFSIDGLAPVDAIPKITAWLESVGTGRKSVNYKLRDWLFARQRYWGEPFPIVWVDGEARPLPEEQLPLALPETKDFTPSGNGESPLANLEHWLKTTDPERGAGAARNQYHAAMGRVLLVLFAFPRSEKQRAGRRSRERTVLDAGRPLHWWQRACGTASSVLPILA